MLAGTIPFKLSRVCKLGYGILFIVCRLCRHGGHWLVLGWLSSGVFSPGWLTRRILLGWLVGGVLSPGASLYLSLHCSVLTAYNYYFYTNKRMR